MPPALVVIVELRYDAVCIYSSTVFEHHFDVIECLKNLLLYISTLLHLLHSIYFTAIVALKVKIFY